MVPLGWHEGLERTQMTAEVAASMNTRLSDWIAQPCKQQEP